jgi:hypothetical protein
MRCVVSPRFAFRTKTAMRSEDSKLARMYSAGVNGSFGLGLAALAIFAGVFYLYGGHETPSGQAPLADLNAANLSELKNEFNGSQANVRMLVLLSPT